MFEFKSPKTLRELASCERESFHPGSNKGANGYVIGDGAGGGNESVLSRRPQYPSDRYHAGSNNRETHFDGTRCGRHATLDYR